ncbi:MAG: DUF433 domain-containing protein [Marinosulfonomonas sp.]|nr:DUF433 domain-containing protein [Marinosulfonomonas sp.]
MMLADTSVMIETMDSAVRDDVVGASVSTAARVIGVSRDRLIGWEKRGMLVPKFGTLVGRRRVWSYSLDDLVLGRIIRVLEIEHKIHVNKISKMIDQARMWELDSPLASLNWSVSGREVIVDHPDGASHGDRQPAQSLAKSILPVDEIRADARRRLERPKEVAGHTERRRGVQGGREVFEGTRVPVETVARYIDKGFDDDRILASFPSLRQADIDEARRRPVAV